MDVREKLVELLENHCSVIGEDNCKASQNEKCTPRDCAICLASNLIANGVTVREWTSVSEPPEENGYYLCYVLTSAVGDKVKYEQMLLYWEDDIWLYRHNSYRMCRNVTHWMPLPQPPKGE